MGKLRNLLPALFWLFACSPVWAASLFEEETVLEVELIGPVDNLAGNMADRREYAFVLRSEGADLDVNVRIRGKSRLRMCKFPPLRLSFEPNGATQTPFTGQDKLKLVTNCGNNQNGEKNLLEEYLAYRIFGLLTEVSYRVRLLHVRYLDTDGHADPDTLVSYGFVIEPTEQLAAREGLGQLKIPGVHLSKLNAEHTALVYVFQYMIGNTDWSFVTAEGEENCCHNGNLVGTDQGMYYVPYDFDLSGIVNAPYAKPDPSLRLRSVRSRRYRGFCTDTDIVQAALRRVTSQREDIYNLVLSTPGLDEEDTKEAIDYLQGFFDKAANEDKLIKSFQRQCLK